MTIGLGTCPACKESLSYEARLCPHCGHPFDNYGSFKGYLRHMDEQKKENERKRKQKSFRHFLIFLLILIVLGGALYLCYIASHASPTTMSADSGSGMIVMPSSTPTASVVSPAITTIQRYYDNVNSKNYIAAYYMWDKQGESLANFQSGYSHTKYDGLVFEDIVPQADGTTKVFVTVNATESTAAGGTRLSVYKGYYIVGKHGNEWKILSGILNRA